MQHDGAGAALNHIYGGLPHPPAAVPVPESLRPFDQTPFFGANNTITGLNSTGFIYVPSSCAAAAAAAAATSSSSSSSTTTTTSSSDDSSNESGNDTPLVCGLHVSLHGCGVNWYYDDQVNHLSFTRWAETNSLVVLFPRMADHDATVQEQAGCWDAYVFCNHPDAAENLFIMHSLV